MAAKVPVALRLSTEKLALVDAYAKARGSSRQVVLERAVDNFLQDAEGGVPDLPVERPVWTPPPAPERTDLLAGRQARLAKEMGWNK